MKIVWISIQGHACGRMARELERTGIKNGDEVSFPTRLAGSGIAAGFERVQFEQFIDFDQHGRSVCQHPGRFAGLDLYG